MTEARRTYLESLRDAIMGLLSRPWLLDTDAARFTSLWGELSRIDKELNAEKEIGD